MMWISRKDWDRVLEDIHDLKDKNARLSMELSTRIKASTVKQEFVSSGAGYGYADVWTTLEAIEAICEHLGIKLIKSEAVPARVQVKKAS